MAIVLTTDGGPHSPETWAMASAEQLVTVDNVTGTGRIYEATKLRLAIADALIGHHTQVQTDERTKLNTDAESHFNTGFDPNNYLAAVVDAVVAAAAATEWAAHFAKDEVKATIAQIVGQHFVDAMHIERLWHAKRNPDSEAGQAYLCKHEGN